MGVPMTGLYVASVGLSELVARRARPAARLNEDDEVQGA